MDYVQEDMDSMLKELDMWQKESSQHKEALQREQRYRKSLSLLATLLLDN